MDDYFQHDIQAEYIACLSERCAAVVVVNILRICFSAIYAQTRTKQDLFCLINYQ